MFDHDVTTDGAPVARFIKRLQELMTSLDPHQKVFLSVEGQSLDREHPLGGEGLILRQPITRSQFDADFPLY